MIFLVFIPLQKHQISVFAPILEKSPAQQKFVLLAMTNSNDKSTGNKGSKGQNVRAGVAVEAAELVADLQDQLTAIEARLDSLYAASPRITALITSVEARAARLRERLTLAENRIGVLHPKSNHLSLFDNLN